ncbi:signal recognition particle receptor subunit beta [Trichonephila inaurata madagascariensis]|uniref:Signal recognition particle receptor subunit beta n=1 Tax=Trichonephila inaurata madagascariensis TaxID=2747483 RepID=A0A8X6XU83_9ARAC|nr:signal recognition particle receptor subunit beta [Trichonephila inaurata madagascariensis]
MEPFKKYIGTIEYDANFYGVLVAIIAVLITIVIFWFLRRKSVNRRNVLITGLSDSGKTLLFSRLVSSKNIVTYTSMKENIAVYRVDKKRTVTLVDIPGNDRLRDKYLEEFLLLARGIIFVVDSFNFQKEIRDVAGFVFRLLQEPIIHVNKVPFLIACNKQDHAVSKSAKVIQSQLEKEINTLRITQTGRLASTSGFSDRMFVGHKGKDFQFSDLKAVKIEFVECSALESDGGVADLLKTWLTKIA